MIFMKKMIIFIAILFTLTSGSYMFLEQNQFGKLPTGDRLEKIKKSKNYRDGAFQNQHFTPDLAEGTSYFDILKSFMQSQKSKIVNRVLLNKFIAEIA